MKNNHALFSLFNLINLLFGEFVDTEQEFSGCLTQRTN